MSFLRAAHAALAGQSGARRIVAALIPALFLAGLSLSCGNSSSSSGSSRIAYATLPALGSVVLLRINDSTGALTVGGQTPQVQGTSPTGLAILPKKTFLYAANSRDNSISIFKVAIDGTLTITGAPTPARGSSPNVAVIDPTGNYLLVTNNLSDTISVFSIDSGTGALSLIGAPVPANPNPTDIRFTHSGLFVYVTNPGAGTVTTFSFNASNGVLTPLTTVVSGDGASALAVDASDQYLYVTNTTANNPPPNSATIGNISAFSIDSSGGLTPLIGSPFTATSGTGPTAIAVDPTGRFVYAVTAGSSNSIWCFAITPATGELVAVAGSPFNLTGGGLFALFGPTGNFFYTGNSAAAIEGYAYDSATGVPTAIAGSPFSTGTAPGKMAF